MVRCSRSRWGVGLVGWQPDLAKPARPGAGYERCGWLAAVTTLVLLWWVGQVRVHGGGASAQANQNQARA